MVFADRLDPWRLVVALLGHRGAAQSKDALQVERHVAEYCAPVSQRFLSSTGCFSSTDLRPAMSPRLTMTVGPKSSTLRSQSWAIPVDSLRKTCFRKGRQRQLPRPMSRAGECIGEGTQPL